MLPKYKIGDRLGEWVVTGLYRHNFDSEWIYVLARTVKNGSIGISCSESELPGLRENVLDLGRDNRDATS